MLLKEMKEKLPYGRVRTFENKRVFYMNPMDLYKYVSRNDWEKIYDWNGICIYPSPKGKPNKAFYFYLGYGGTPENTIEITINA